jgi:hypothetical protein
VTEVQITQKKLRKARGGTKVKPDGHFEKKNPTGIEATIRAITQYWFSNTGEAQEIREFLTHNDSEFEKIATSVLARYSGVGNEVREFTSYITNMETGQKHLKFFELLIFAELLKIPTGLFLFFTQMVSDEHRFSVDDTKKTQITSELLLKIRRALNALNALEKHLLTCDPAKQSCDFLLRDPTGTKYLANIDVLKAMTEAYNLTD